MFAVSKVDCTYYGYCTMLEEGHRGQKTSLQMMAEKWVRTSFYLSLSLSLPISFSSLGSYSSLLCVSICGFFSITHTQSGKERQERQTKLSGLPAEGGPKPGMPVWPFWSQMWIKSWPYYKIFGPKMWIRMQRKLMRKLWKLSRPFFFTLKTWQPWLRKDSH